MRYLFALLAVFILWGCSVEVPRDEYVAYFDKNCKTEIERSGIHFFALALTPDYERAKWGSPLDSGMRVVFGATPRTDLSFDTAFLISERDTAEVIVKRKMQTFELGVADMFVLSFADRRDGAKLRLKNVSHGIGGVELELKNCKNIRLVENK
ncbi:MAG: hypothetical protein J6Y14_11635 [Fibrobacter sp.]|nr:hypothetical protein [Fibrobacter sp.]